MGLFSVFKAAKAYKLHTQGQLDEARAIYEEVLKDGPMDPRYMLSYAVLLIRAGEYQKAREILVKTQKLPGITAEQKTQLFMNYAACMYKLGDIDKGIGILERQHAKQPSGMVYQTLGYLYVEKLQNKPDPNEPAPVPETADEQEEGMEAAVPAEPVLTPYQQWEVLLEKTQAFLDEACDYDDEDPVCLDNMAQFHYRVLNDKETALQYFKRAIAIKPGQIDTLWFLSRYDLDNGDTAAAKEKLHRMKEGKFSALNHVTLQDVEAELKRLGD